MDEVMLTKLLDGFESAGPARGPARRVGLELKFPLVGDDGKAPGRETVDRLWAHLVWHGWRPVRENPSGRTIGVKLKGERNDTRGGVETGYCKLEFALAHTADLAAAETAFNRLIEVVRPFLDRNGLHLLGYGIHPVELPSERLLARQSRAQVWDAVCRSNREVPPDEGHDLHLFTLNAGSHVHVAVDRREALEALNVLNGFSAALIALTANSPVWRGRLDARRSVAGSFWDSWTVEPGRSGMPERPFRDLADYCRTVCRFRPVFVRRQGVPVLVEEPATFSEFLLSGGTGRTLEGKTLRLRPELSDMGTHSTCYWFDARISRHHTVESRIADQQPPGEQISVGAVVLGLVESAGEAGEEISSQDWSNLRTLRREALGPGLGGCRGEQLATLAARMLDLAGRGLARRDKGEERFLEPLRRRLSRRRPPAVGAIELYERSGIESLVDGLSIGKGHSS
jgi:glutamate--cysteine ligase